MLNINTLKECWMLVLISIFLPTIHGHGRLIQPASRSSLWRFGYEGAVTNYQDNELFCGGSQYQWKQQGGKCGLCGDPYDKPRENEAGGKYAKHIIARTYNKGTSMEVKVDLTANHKGWFEFRLCKNDDFDKRFTQECLDKHILPEVNNPSKTRFPVSPNNNVKTYNLQLPNDLTCSQCVLQWKYNTGNSWGEAENGTACVGCGPQEQFYGCSDIAIEGSGPISTPRPTTSSTSTFSQTTTAVPTTSKPPTASPTTSKPTTASPTTSKPTTASPTTSKPTTASPTTSKPTTAVPTTSKPRTAVPTTSKPTTAVPTTSKPTTASPTTSKPTTASPTTSKPTTASPTTSKPTTASPTTSKPPTASPTTSKPTTASPTTSKPTTASPTTSEPTTATPMTFKPTTRSPATSKPTTVSPRTTKPTTARPTTSIDTTTMTTKSTLLSTILKSTTTTATTTTSSRKKCKGVYPFNWPGMDRWCNINCYHNPPFCPQSHCVCV